MTGLDPATQFGAASSSPRHCSTRGSRGRRGGSRGKCCAFGATPTITRAHQNDRREAQSLPCAPRACPRVEHEVAALPPLQDYSAASRGFGRALRSTPGRIRMIGAKRDLFPAPPRAFPRDPRVEHEVAALPPFQDYSAASRGLGRARLSTCSSIATSSVSAAVSRACTSAKRGPRTMRSSSR